MSRLKLLSAPTTTFNLFCFGVWVLVGYMWWSGWFATEQPLVVAPILLALVSSLYLLLRGGDRLTAMAGKALIVMGVMYLVTYFLNEWTLLLSATKLWSVGVIVYGLYLERISPHQQFYDWMFLAIASKVQFVLVSATITQLTNEPAWLVPAWWLLVVLVILSIPLAAKREQRWFRFLVVVTTGYSIILLVVTSWQHSVTGPSLLLLLLTALWPNITDRWVGRRVFKKI